LGGHCLIDCVKEAATVNFSEISMRAWFNIRGLGRCLARLALVNPVIKDPSNKFVAGSQLIAKALKNFTQALHFFCLCWRTHVVLGGQVCAAPLKIEPAMM